MAMRCFYECRFCGREQEPFIKTEWTCHRCKKTVRTQNEKPEGWTALRHDAGHIVAFCEACF